MRILSFLFLLLCGSLSVSGQDFRGAFHIEQKEFREENDSLHIRFLLQVDSRAIASCEAVVFEPEISDDGHNRIELPYIQLTGKERARLNRRWFNLCSDKWFAGYRIPYRQVFVNKYTNETLDYTFSIPFHPWMGNARLVLKQKTIGCAGRVYLHAYTLAGKAEIAVREPQRISPRVALADPKEEVKTRSRQGSAFLDFQVNRSDILPDFRRNPVELGKINDALMDIMVNADVQITGIFIEGYASPEGAYASNERLARERAVALKEHIRKVYMFADGLFKVKSVAEDWDGLKAHVEGSSDLPQRDAVLAIINSADTPDRKEQRLKALSVYSRLLRDVFPELRRVEYQIDYAVRSYSETEVRSLIGSHPENLSHAELYRLACSYGKESSEYKRIIMEVIPKYYENDAVALNNAAALLIGNGELNTALRLLDKARGLPAAWNNRAVVYLLQDNPEQAMELLKQAALAGVKEAEENLAKSK